ncbi:MAG TPA: NAD(P)/FAD-dependent oxidoreductase [Candidatus Dormibacteraeota bacterium]|nr:NAD(P)/FAD-dependent oxidoreductase [Candidatus Dormibacteraeota bacterium]
MGDHPRDAVVVGSGPNGLAAAVTLAEAGRSVLVVEAAPEPGGGLRTVELLEPGFRHDLCAAVMAMASVSPFLSRHELDLVTPPAALAHPLDDGRALLLERSVEATAEGLGADRRAYERLMRPLVARAVELATDVLGPLRPPRHPLLLARFGALGLLPAARLARMLFSGAEARALFAGVAAHSMLSLHEPVSAAVGLVMLVTAHHGGWPLGRGGAATVAGALVRRLRELGGEIRCGLRVDSVDELPTSGAVLLDLVPRGVLEVAGHRLPGRYRRALARYRYGPGVFKLDWTLEGPIPWRAPECRRAATIHLGGTLEEIAAAEQDVAAGRHPARPFVILVQPTLFDPSRAPAGRHVAWAYCHVPNGSDRDMTEAIEAQIERFAPGFRDLVRRRSALGPRQVELRDANYVGGDINGGRQDLRQLFFRPVVRWTPYVTPDPRLFICSAATPPGGGVHGMCGWHAARAVLRR